MNSFTILLDRASTIVRISFLFAMLMITSAAHAQVVTFNSVGNEFQSYTVPAEGWYLLDVRGAQGGPASNNSHQGGKGAWMQGYEYLLVGDELRIAVGGAGKQGQNDKNNVSGGGGGGGSSIVLVNGSTDVPLLMAGGGGGAAANYNGSSGLSGESGGPPNGGVNGGGGRIGADPYGGAGGAGYLTDGGTHFDGNTLLSYGGQAYVSGNFGGGSGQNGGGGGWGGGGSGGPAKSSAFSNKDGGGGGGGGYSGGGGGANQGDGGGGGGSYVDANLDTTLCAAVRGYRSGDGLVEITPVSGPPVIGQPADQQVATGASVTLGPVYDDPTGQTTYQWMKDGVVLYGQTDASLNIASFQFTDSGGYQAIVKQPLATFITLPTFLSSSSPQSTLQGWGLNDDGQLGLWDTNDRYEPTLVTSDVAPGIFINPDLDGDDNLYPPGHSLFVKRDGSLWAMGDNEYGQLGLGDTSDRHKPTHVTSVNDVVAVAAGFKHSLFVKRDGTLWAMGDNKSGQLGLGDTEARDTPTQVTSVNDVVAVAAGGNHSLFVKRDGTLWAMGDNESGQLGLGDTEARDKPTQVTSDVVAVAGGAYHSLFVKRDGTLWAMGDNESGQLGLGDTEARDKPTQVTSDVVAVAGGAYHSLFVKSDGTLWTMGSNGDGQLGLGDTSDRYKPTQVTSVNDVVAVAAGFKHSLFVKGDGTLWAMGGNQNGQLGLGDTAHRDTPTQVYFRGAANVPTTPLIVATLPKIPTAQHSLAIAAPAPAVLVLAASSDDQGGPAGIFEITLQETPTGDFAEARVVDQETGWRAEVMFWQDQEAVRFMVRFQDSSGPQKDFTAFGFFPQGKPEEIQYLALKTKDLKQIGIKLSANASNQAKYKAFQKLMNSATWDQLVNSWGGVPEIDLIVLVLWF